MQEIPRADASALVKLINSTTLLNKQLSTICQLNGLTSSGVKAHLQARIVNCQSLSRASPPPLFRRSFPYLLHPPSRVHMPLHASRRCLDYLAAQGTVATSPPRLALPSASTVTPKQGTTVFLLPPPWSFKPLINTLSIKLYNANKHRSAVIQETINQQDLDRFRQIESSVRTTRANGNNFRASPAKPIFDQASVMAPHQNRNNPYGGLAGPGGAQTAHANGYYGGIQGLLGAPKAPRTQVMRTAAHGIRPGLQGQSFLRDAMLHRCRPHMRGYVDPPQGAQTRRGRQAADRPFVKAMSQHRNAVSLTVRAIDYSFLSKCATDKSLRILVFCAGDQQGVQDIAFPHQSEVKVNGGEVKANLRGLKNKPGSTRPVDVTDLLRLKPANYENRVDLVYALTQKVRFHRRVLGCRGQIHLQMMS